MNRNHLARAVWRKSTRSSNSGNGQCVEVAYVAQDIAVRDSKDSSGSSFAMLTVDRSEWLSVIAELRKSGLTG